MTTDNNVRLSKGRSLNRGGRSYQGERVDTQIYCIQEEAMDAHICPSGKGRTIISRRKVGVA